MQKKNTIDLKKREQLQKTFKSVAVLGMLALFSNLGSLFNQSEKEPATKQKAIWG